MHQHLSISNPQRIILAMLGGLSLFLLTVVVYTRLTSNDPFRVFFSTCRSTGNAIALLHLTVLLGYWALVSRAVLVSTSTVLTFITFAFVLPGALLWLYPGDVEDCLRIGTGRHSWWLALIVTALSTPFGIRALQVGSAIPLVRWQVVGGISFTIGIALYVAGPSGGLSYAILAKIIFVLLIPIACLLVSAVKDREKPTTLRAAFALAAGIGIVAATIC